MKCCTQDTLDSFNRETKGTVLQVRVLVHTPLALYNYSTYTHCKALNCVDTWPQWRQSVISQLRGLTDHSICWWIHLHTAADKTDATPSERSHLILFLLLKYFPGLPSFPARLLLQMRACCCTKPAFAAIQSGGFSAQPKSGEQERERGFSGLEHSFMTLNTICIIVCISCSVSTQCQHGWSVLISRLHHIDKRNTCRYKVILLPTAHVKLFRRTRQAGSYCSCMNGQIIASWFLKAKSLILTEVGSLLLLVNLWTCIVQQLCVFSLTYWFGYIISNAFYIIHLIIYNIFTSDFLSS